MQQDSSLSPAKRPSLGPHRAPPGATCWREPRRRAPQPAGLPPLAPRLLLPSPPPGCPPASRPLELAGRSRPRDRGEAALRPASPPPHAGLREQVEGPGAGDTRDLPSGPTARGGAKVPVQDGGRRASGPQPPPQGSTSGGCALVASSRPQNPPRGLKLRAGGTRPPEPIRARERPGAGPALSPRPRAELGAPASCRYSALAFPTF